MKGSSPKTPFHKINNKINKILEEHLRRSKPPPKRQTYIQQLTGNEPPTGIPKVSLILIVIIRKNLEWPLPKILFTIKVKIVFTKFAHKILL